MLPKAVTSPQEQEGDQTMKSFGNHRVYVFDESKKVVKERWFSTAEAAFNYWKGTDIPKGYAIVRYYDGYQMAVRKGE